jgi:hypothetical protein
MQDVVLPLNGPLLATCAQALRSSGKVKRPWHELRVTKRLGAGEYREFSPFPVAVYFGETDLAEPR